MKPEPAPSWLALWAWPTAISSLSAIGLVGGLCGGAAWYWLTWIGLGLPLALAAWFGLGRRSRCKCR